MYAVDVTSPAQLPLVSGCRNSGGLSYNFSVPYPKLGLKNTGNIELGAAPLIQYYSLYHGLAIYTEVTFVNVTLVESGPSGDTPAVV